MSSPVSTPQPTSSAPKKPSPDTEIPCGADDDALFVIVRHGNTFASGETPRRIGARTDLPLTEAGRDQARALGAHFQKLGMHFAQVLMSPLQRTSETARLILAGLANPPEPEICDWLREIDHGPDENQSEEQVLARIGHDALARWDSDAVPPPDWVVDADGRKDAWRELLDADRRGPTLLVTSNGAARFALQAARDRLLPGSELPDLKMPTGSFGLIRRRADGHLEVPVWGQRP